MTNRRGDRSCYRCRVRNIPVQRTTFVDARLLREDRPAGGGTRSLTKCACEALGRGRRVLCRQVIFTHSVQVSRILIANRIPRSFENPEEFPGTQLPEEGGTSAFTSAETQILMNSAARRGRDKGPGGEGSCSRPRQSSGAPQNVNSNKGLGGKSRSQSPGRPGEEQGRPRVREIGRDLFFGPSATAADAAPAVTHLEAAFLCVFRGGLHHSDRQDIQTDYLIDFMPGKVTESVRDMLEIPNYV